MDSPHEVIDFPQRAVYVPPPQFKHFKRILRGMNVEPARLQIEANPQLWNAHPGRTGENSPHYGVSDLWLRFRPLDELRKPADYTEPHFPVWYPGWRVLTAVHPIVYNLMATVEAVHLGGILLTKIPPGGAVKPHRDHGWHATYHNCKLYVAIQSNPECRNYCEDEAICIKTGECWSFNNLVTHSVENSGLSDRITLIICCRVEP